MKFRKKMKPIIKRFGSLPYEAVDWYRTSRGAMKKAKEYERLGFKSMVNYNPAWSAYFVYITNFVVVIEP